MNTEKIIGMLRVNPQNRVDTLIQGDIGPLVEKLVTSASPATMREHIGAHLRAVYAEAARVIGLEHSVRVAAQLHGATDFAEATELWKALGALAQLDTLSPAAREIVDRARSVPGRAERYVEFIEPAGGWDA